MDLYSLSHSYHAKETGEKRLPVHLHKLSQAGGNFSDGRPVTPLWGNSSDLDPSLSQGAYRFYVAIPHSQGGHNCITPGLDPVETNKALLCSSQVRECLLESQFGSSTGQTKSVLQSDASGGMKIKFDCYIRAPMERA